MKWKWTFELFMFTIEILYMVVVKDYSVKFKQKWGEKKSYINVKFIIYLW